MANDLQIAVATIPSIARLTISMEIVYPGGSFPETLPLFSDGTDIEGYNLFSISIPLTVAVLDISDLLGPISATVTGFNCYDAADDPLACDFAAQVPTTITYESAAEVPEPSAFLLFLAGLALLAAMSLRPSSSLVGSPRRAQSA